MNDEFIPVSKPSLTAIERSNLLDAFDSSWISSTGRYLSEFEDRFSVACGSKYAVAVANGTVALHLALTALGVGPGDEVIVPSLTYIATANAVRYAGATPVFADVSTYDWCMDLTSAERLFGAKTKAIISVDLYGQPGDMVSLRELSSQAGLLWIEDAAEAPFSSRDGITTGSLADVTTFSFYGNKIISSGEGGAVTTNDPEIAARMRQMRGQGMDPNRRYWFPITGFNYRLTNLAAAVLCGQLTRLDGIFRARRRIYSIYDEKIWRTRIDRITAQGAV